MNRESGFYWVQYHEGEWMPAEWSAKFDEWFLPGFDARITNKDLVRVGSRIYPPSQTEAK